MQLKRLDLAPPGGFTVETPLGVELSDTSFTWLAQDYLNHCVGNGIIITEDEAQREVEEQTADRLMTEGRYEWVMYE